MPDSIPVSLSERTPEELEELHARMQALTAEIATAARKRKRESAAADSGAAAKLAVVAPAAEVTASLSAESTPAQMVSLGSGLVALGQSVQ